MADFEVHDEVVSNAPAARSGGGGMRPRPVLTESITLGERADSARADTPRGEDDEIRLGAHRGRALSTNAQRMLANIDKHGTVDDSAPTTVVDETPGEEPAKPAEPSQDNKPAEAAAPVPPPAQEPAPDPVAEHRAVNDRLTARNRELVAENERLKAGGAKREATAREKALDEIERSYLDDPIGAIRRLQALALGIDDAKHADIDTEMQGLYQDLTAKELGVSLDESKQAKREAARTRQLLARQKREQTAEQEAASKPREAPEATQAAQMHQVIGNQLSIKRSDGKSIAERHPLLSEFATELGGAKPEALIWDEVRRGIAAGDFDPKTPDDKLVEAAASNLETRYQALADRFVKARTPAPSTAPTPTPAAEVKADTAAGNGHGTRTITNASASVAPSTPPAAKTEQKADDKPKWRNEKERRMYLAKLRAGEA